MMQLLIEVPIASFRQSRAREYAETYPVPPPATVYGMLLSLIGEWNRYRYVGTKLAIAMLSKPQLSTVIRTFRRFKTRNITDPANARPDYQQLLTDVQLWVGVVGELGDHLLNFFRRPELIERWGGLCLGESHDLVNIIRQVEECPKNSQCLVKDSDGLLTLPYWVDHVGSQGTRWQRYSLHTVVDQLPEEAWTEIKSD